MNFLAAFSITPDISHSRAKVDNATSRMIFISVLRCPRRTVVFLWKFGVPACLVRRPFPLKFFLVPRRWRKGAHKLLYNPVKMRLWLILRYAYHDTWNPWSSAGVSHGVVAQVAERPLCMRKVRGSIPRCSIFLFSILLTQRNARATHMNTSRTRPASTLLGVLCFSFCILCCTVLVIPNDVFSMWLGHPPARASRV